MSTGKILVVDDDPQIRRVMRATLSGNHYEVVDARSGEEALDRFRQEMPDLVLLDMNMPGMGGLETCRALRQGADVPILILSVQGDEALKISALDAGADDYLTKPFGQGELLARLRAALRRAGQHESEPVFVTGDLSVDLLARAVRLGERDRWGGESEREGEGEERAHRTNLQRDT